MPAPAARGSEWHWLWKAYVAGLLVVAMVAVVLLQGRFGVVSAPVIGTVKTHLLRAFNRLGVSDRTAAVTTAMSLGLLP